MSVTIARDPCDGRAGTDSAAQEPQCAAALLGDDPAQVLHGRSLAVDGPVVRREHFEGGGQLRGQTLHLAQHEARVQTRS